MIVLDTNVVSELLRPVPEPRVVAWVDEQPAADLFLTATTVGELLAGVALLENGARRRRLAARIAVLVETEFAERLLPFDGAAAVEHARIVALRRRLGAPISTADAVIAATAAAAGATLATRNTGDFVHLGLGVVDPWSEA